MRPVIRDATEIDVLTVAATMRDSDWNEISALFPRCVDRLDIGRIAWAKSPDYKWVCYDHDAPVAAFGGMEFWPGVWSLWMFANDLWSPRVATVMVGFMRDVFLSEMPRRGAHRLECKSEANHADAHRFIRKLGLEEEGFLRGYGRDRQDFRAFALVRPV